MDNTGNTTSGTKIILIAKDGYKISATRYDAVTPVKAHLVVAGATGVPQKFYRRFSEYACQNGFTTLTLDYRGLGESKQGSLKGFPATYPDWAQLDLAAAVYEMHSDTVPLFMIGHSFGGHAFGLLPNHHLIKKFYTFATGAGWAGWMPYSERWRVHLLWHVILPIIIKFKGYLAWSKLGMGEDLPLQVFEQWKYWCQFPHYLFDDPDAQDLAKLFKDVQTPICAANSLDDKWATPKSRDAFIQGYSNAPIETRDIDPKDFPGGIGHMGYFKSSSKPLWEDVLKWFIPVED